MSLIHVKGVSKKYIVTTGIFKRKKREVIALSNVNFEIKAGEIFCPIGPNGAGKTTLIKLLSTLALPNSGQILVDGFCTSKEPEKIRKKIGVLYGGERGLYWRISARDNLIYFGNLYEIPPKKLNQQIDYLLELVGLTDRQHDRIETFSKGMKQRIHLARCLLHDPEIIFLDEPTLGLDVEASRNIRKLIRDLKCQGKTIILTSHYMNEIEELADRIALIYKGTIKEIDTVQNFKNNVNNMNLEDAYLSILKKKEIKEVG
ncbi:MAG: ABC transporter ATP-binding protein [Desulfobacterales bacterium]|nr:ABC transporter ATP-binding protein [Desulfobacterales bacterium]